jgi:hypothetical protein
VVYSYNLSDLGGVRRKIASLRLAPAVSETFLKNKTQTKYLRHDSIVTVLA